jgi:beta-1,4-glucosyltransferase
MAKQIINISGFSIQNISRISLRDDLLSVISKNGKVALFFANTNFVVKCRFLLQSKITLQKILVNDGIGMNLAAKLFYGESFVENLNGTDFIPFLFNSSKHPFRIFMLGGRPDILEKAVNHVEQVLGQKVVGSCHGYTQLGEMLDLVNIICKAKPDVILVAMGNPKQEEWIVQNFNAVDTNVFIGVGALFDFWSGDKSRAPYWIRNLRLEWFYRLCLEPRRLLRRYTSDIIIFIRDCIKYRSSK